MNAQCSCHDQQSLEKSCSGYPYSPLGSNLVSQSTEACAEKEREKGGEGLTVGNFEAIVARVSRKETSNSEGELYESTG